MKSVHLYLISAIVACVFLVDMCHGTGDGKNESIITAVNRKTDSDMYYNISTHTNCKKQKTFMVEERTCIKNEDLLKGKF